MLDNLTIPEKIPPLGLTIGADRFIVHPLDLMGDLIPSLEEEGKFSCTLKVTSSEISHVLGIPFFNSNLVVFDKANKRIGMKF